MTSIELPGLFGSGLAEWDRKTPAEMIERYRTYAQSQVGLYAAILAAPDEDYRIETYRGVYVKKNTEVLQEGRPRPVRKAAQ